MDLFLTSNISACQLTTSPEIYTFTLAEQQKTAYFQEKAGKVKQQIKFGADGDK